MMMTDTEKAAWVRMLKRHIAHLTQHGVAERMIAPYRANLQRLLS